MQSRTPVAILQCESLQPSAAREGVERKPRLNTFLELKIENERLQQRVAHLRAQAKAFNVVYPASSPASPSTSSSVQFSQHVPQTSGDAFFTAYDETPGTSGQGQDTHIDADEDGSDPNGSRKKVSIPLRLFGGCLYSMHLPSG